jgi:hypothetical protein
MSDLLQETAAPEDMFDDLAGQGAPAPAATAAAEVLDSTRSCAAVLICWMAFRMQGVRQCMHSRAACEQSQGVQVLSCSLQEDDEEIEELLAAAEAMPLTQPEDAAMAMAAPPAPVTASQVICPPAASAADLTPAEGVTLVAVEARDITLSLRRHALPSTHHPCCWVSNEYNVYYTDSQS